MKYQYVGRVTRLIRGGNAGFIASDSIPKGPGGKIYTDVFVHNDDCDKPLFKGAKVTFEIEFSADKRRRSQWRAVNARVTECRPGIELHFDTSVPIAHPLVEARICYSPEMYREKTRLLQEGYGFALLLRMRQEGPLPHEGTRHFFLADHALPMIAFSRSGKWKLTLMLIQGSPNEAAFDRSRDLLDRLRRAFRNDTGSSDSVLGIPPSYELVVLDDPLHQEAHFPDNNNFPFEDDFKTRLVAMSEVEVEIPSGIFAPEPPTWFKEYAIYFFKGRVLDQCQFRRRWPLMVLQFPLWLLWEACKRMVHGVVSIAQTLDMRQGGFQNFLATFRRKVRFQIMNPDRARDDSDNYRGRIGPWSKRYGYLFTPLALVLYAALVRLLIYSGQKAIEHSSATIVVTITLAICAVLIVMCIFCIKKAPAALEKLVNGHIARLERRKEEKVQIHLRQLQAARTEQARIAEAQGGILVCGGEGTQTFSFSPRPEEMLTLRGRLTAFRRALTLEPVPEELRTNSLRFQAVKRVVCAPFQR